jgi:hypothetical protein
MSIKSPAWQNIPLFAIALHAGSGILRHQERFKVTITDLQFAKRLNSGTGLTFQTPAAYSATVRSLENLPERPMFVVALRVQSARSCRG